MGGFANLKKDFECLTTLRPDSHAPDVERDSIQDELVFKYLLLRCLFEINGNLDQIALRMNEIAAAETAAFVRMNRDAEKSKTRT